MQPPIVWTAPAPPALESEPAPKYETLKLLLVLLVLAITTLAWFVSAPEFHWSMGLLLAIPEYLCLAFLGAKLFHVRSRWSVANSGFSFGRILIGLGIGMLALAFALTILVSATRHH
jgi:hypothetical protein